MVGGFETSGLRPSFFFCVLRKTLPVYFPEYVIMSGRSSPVLYPIGDNHIHEREDVAKRARSLLPDSADVMVMEHPVKGDDRAEPSNWAALKNPCLLLFQLLVIRFQQRRRKGSGRAAKAGDSFVYEEVAEEAGLELEYTDISHRNRVALQPLYLTLISNAVFFGGLLGLIVSLWISFILLVLGVPAVALLSQNVYNRMREGKMAEDLKEYGERFDEVVFVAGDSHIDPVCDAVGGRFGIVRLSGSRI